MDKSVQIYHLERKLSSKPTDKLLLNNLLKLLVLQESWDKSGEIASRLIDLNGDYSESLELYIQKLSHKYVKEESLDQATKSLKYFARKLNDSKLQDLLYFNLGEACYKIAIRKGKLQELIDNLSQCSETKHLENFAIVLSTRDKTMETSADKLQTLATHAKTPEELITLARLMMKEASFSEIPSIAKRVLAFGSELRYRELKQILQFLSSPNLSQFHSDSIEELQYYSDNTSFKSPKQKANFTYLLAEAIRNMGEIKRAAQLYQDSIIAQISFMSKKSDSDNIELKKPEFIIFGVMKCGTSTLYDLIIQHPNVLPAATKELHYIQSELRKNNSFDSPDDNVINEIESFYPYLFPKRSKNSRFITGEASGYSIFEKGVHLNLKKITPDSRLIAIIRDPVKRAVSHYNHRVRAKVEQRTLIEALREELNYYQSFENYKVALEDNISRARQHKYLSHGFYHYWLKDWFQTFDPNQIHVLDNAFLKKNQELCLNQLFNFFDLKPFQIPPKKQKNVGNYTFSIPGDIQDELKELYAEDYNLLRGMLPELKLNWF